MIKPISETDKAWEKNKTSLTEAGEELSKKEKDKKRMAELRAKKKPPKMVGVHPSILEKGDDYFLSHKKKAFANGGSLRHKIDRNSHSINEKVRIKITCGITKG